jgi:hypothetical protein
MAEAEELELDITEEEAFEAHEYGISTNVDDNTFRLQFYDEDRNVLSSFVSDAADAYTLAQRILRAYDILEGIT